MYELKNEIDNNIIQVISNLKLNIICYNKFISVVILIIGSVVVARVFIHAGLSVD